MKKDFDIATNMLMNLEAEKLDQDLHVTDIHQALQSLSKAANLMDDLKCYKMSEIVTKVMEKVAVKINKESLPDSSQ